VKKLIVFNAVVLIALLITPLAFSDVFISRDGTGTYVGGLPNLMPNGTYVGGTPTLTPDGIYVDGTPKKSIAFKKWKQKQTFDK